MILKTHLVVLMSAEAVQHRSVAGRFAPEDLAVMLDLWNQLHRPAKFILRSST